MVQFYERSLIFRLPLGESKVGTVLCHMASSRAANISCTRNRHPKGAAEGCVRDAPEYIRCDITTPLSPPLQPEQVLWLNPDSNGGTSGRSFARRSPYSGRLVGLGILQGIHEI